MSLLQRAVGEIYEPRGAGWAFLSGTYSGKTVTVGTSLNLVPVYNAVSQIAGGVGVLPLKVYQRDGAYRETAEDHRAWSLLHDLPNPEMSADEVWELVASHLELWGNAYLYKKRDRLGIVRELWPLAPSRIAVGRDAEAKRLFTVDGQPFGEETILHIRNLSLDGLVGYSPIQLARNALANSMSQEEFQGRFLKGDGKPSIILKHPNKLNPDAAKRLKAGWDNTKAGGTAVLEEGIEVEQWTMPLEDAQFIEQMEFSDKRIAQLFLLPPGRLGAKSGDSLQYSTVESEGLQFVTYTLQRRLKRIEGAINRDPSIFTDRDRKFFAEFNVDGLLRADIKSRYQSYMIGVNAGFLDAEEDIRPKENLPRRAVQPPPPQGDPPDGNPT